MRVSFFRMDKQIDSSQNSMDSGLSLPPSSPFQRPVVYSSNFGGARHGFNTPVPDRFLHYNPEGNCYHRYQPVLPPLNASARTASDFVIGPVPPVYIPNVSRVHSIPEDVDMPTPVPSRTPSRMHGLQSASNGLRGQEPVCICNNNFGTDGHSTPIVKLATNAHNVTRQPSRISIDQLLSHTPIFRAPSISNQNLNTRQLNTSQRLPTTVSMSICSTTTSSSTVYSSSFNTAEECYYLLNILYTTCLSATTSYISSLPLTRRRRFVSSRYHPYESPKPPGTIGKRGKRAGRGGKEVTLMDNISTICTRLWRKARRDPMAPHREEGGAVREMMNLFVWGEVVARCMESDGLDGSEDDSGSDATVRGVEGENEVEVGFPGMKVAKAAMKLCNWLGDEDAWDTCDTVMDELKDLVEDEGMVTAEEGGGGGGLEFGSIL